MRALPLAFLGTAVIYALIGMALGIFMAASRDHTLGPVHVHLNLVGWVSLALFGLYYQLVPAAAASAMAKWHFWIATVGLWLFVPGIGVAVTGGSEGLVVVGSLITWVSMAWFLVIVLRHRQAA